MAEILFLILIGANIGRSFKYLRIFTSFSPIVTMVTNVIFDLKQFIFFYFMLCGLLALILGILQTGNINMDGEFKQAYDGSFLYPGSEYRYMSLMFGNFFSMMRVSIGDTAMIVPSNFVNRDENILFWITFSVSVVFSNIIFLNFIIAEASASYEKVSAHVQEYINKDRARLISESESMQPLSFRKPMQYPPYIIRREVAF